MPLALFRVLVLSVLVLFIFYFPKTTLDFIFSALEFMDQRKEITNLKPLASYILHCYSCSRVAIINFGWIYFVIYQNFTQKTGIASEKYSDKIEFTKKLK